MNTLVFTSQNNIGVMKMSKEKLNKQNKENKKTATRQDGPGGN